MRMLRTTGCAALLAASFAGLGGVAGAAAKPSTSACDKIQLTEADLSGLGGKDFDASSFSDAASAFKQGAKAAPPKVKRAMLTMASYYKKIGNADSVGDALTSISAKDTEKYTKASVAWGTYIATNC
jgi:hypothetical protein